MFFFYLPSLHTYSCVSLSFMVLPVLYVHSLCLAHPRVLSFRKVKLENELAAQLWRVFWEDIQINNLEKTLRRTCSRLTLSMVRTHTHTDRVHCRVKLNDCVEPLQHSMQTFNWKWYISYTTFMLNITGLSCFSVKASKLKERCIFFNIGVLAINMDHRGDLSGSVYMVFLHFFLSKKYGKT